MEKTNPTPVVMLTVNEYGECDKWFNMNDNICFDVVCIWTKRGMAENMYDYFNRVLVEGYQVDVILPKPAVKYTMRKPSDLDDLCSLFEMLYG